MTHPFEFQGRPHQLIKHPAHLAAHRAGRLAAEQLAATAWYLRFTDATGQRIQRQVGRTLGDALAKARGLLGIRAKPGFRELLEASRLRQTLTLGQLAAEWLGLRCPRRNGKVRTPAQVARLRPELEVALRWWGPRGVAAIRGSDLNAYAAHRRSQARPGFTGERSCDIELGQLSNLCQWALGADRIPANPFAGRARYRDAKEVSHCRDHMPSGTEELHRLIAWFFTPPLRAPQSALRVVQGAQLLFCALTGLRPGEPGALLRPAGPVHREHPRPGDRWDTETEGQPRRLLAVAREKGGQNLAIVIRPALAQFLEAWDAWLARELPAAKYLFPDPAQPDQPLVPFGDSKGRLRRELNAAVRALGLPHRKPHGMRAYYVRVRRSANVADVDIASELGQSGGEKLIRSTYGDPRDIRGHGTFGWLPEPPARACWELLHPATAEDTTLVTANFWT